MEDKLSWVHILMEQSRYAEAEKHLKQLLSEEANNVDYLALFAEVNLQQDKNDIAIQTIKNAIGLAPDFPDLFYIKSRIHLQLDEYDEAEQSIQQGIHLDPFDDNYFALWAHIKLHRKQYEKALELANKALELDAENLLALNTRSTALIKLDRSEESFETIEGALREDPNNAFTHSNYGWGLLEKGNHKKALEHFQEALKIDPNFPHAQVGMMEALKAKNIVYRGFLKYSFWMGNMTSKYQWGFIIGFYLGYRLLSALARSNEALSPFITPILILFALFAFSTWIIEPFSNLFLRLNKYGQHLLSRKQKISSNFVGMSLLLCLISIGLILWTGGALFFMLAVFGFAMMVPLSKMFTLSRIKNGMLYYTLAMAFAGILAIGTFLNTGEVINTFSSAFALGFIAFQWIANFLVIDRTNV